MRNVKKRMNKKAQEGGASAATIIGWVLLAILLVIVVLALSGFFNPILEKLNLFPGSGVAALVKACDSYVQVSSKTDYCNFREVKVEGNKEWVNCVDSRIQQDVASETKGKYICEDAYKNQTCTSLIKKGVKNVPLVNSESCPSYRCGEIGGELSDTDKKCPKTGATEESVKSKIKAITVGIKELNENVVCCVLP